MGYWVGHKNTFKDGNGCNKKRWISIIGGYANLIIWNKQELVTHEKIWIHQIAVVGTRDAGVLLAVLLSQYHEVYAVDIVPEKVEK